MAFQQLLDTAEIIVFIAVGRNPTSPTVHDFGFDQAPRLDALAVRFTIFVRLHVGGFLRPLLVEIDRAAVRKRPAVGLAVRAVFYRKRDRPASVRLRHLDVEHIQIHVYLGHDRSSASLARPAGVSSQQLRYSTKPERRAHWSADWTLVCAMCRRRAIRKD